MKTIKLILIVLSSSLLWNCTTSDLLGHFHAEANRTEKEVVEVQIKMPARLGETPVFLAKFEPVGRILAAPQEGVENPGREEVRVGTLYFSANPKDELEEIREMQGDNEIYSYNPGCDYLNVMIKLNPDDLEKVKFASAAVDVPQDVKKVYSGNREADESLDECFKPFSNLEANSSKQSLPQLGFIYFHGGHVPPKNIEPGMDGIPIE